MFNTLPTVAILGGTGHLGSGLAYQLAKKGYRVIIGSRSADHAQATARQIADRAGRVVEGRENSAAAAAAEIVILAVPYAHHAGVLESVRGNVQGKIFVDTTVPLVPPRVARAQVPQGGPVARQSQDFLGENVRVVSAFQNVAAVHLQEDRLHFDGDVLVCGNDPEAREVVVRMAQDIGLQAWHAGVIDNSVVAESLTSVLLFINKRYHVGGAGIRVMGDLNVANTMAA